MGTFLNLTPEMQAGIADSGTPSPAPTAVPMAPAGQQNATAPDLGQPDAVANAPEPGSFAAKLQASIQKLTAVQTQNGTAGQPGAWSKALVGGTIDALHTSQPSTPQTRAQAAAGAAKDALTGLSDAANIQTKPGQGWLAGVEQTLANRGERVAKEKQQDFQNSQESQRTAAQIAYNQAQTAAMTRNMQRQDSEQRANFASANAAWVNAQRNNYSVQDDISQDDLNAMVKKDPNYLQTHYGAVTRYQAVIGPDGQPKLDKNGAVIETPMWSIVSREPKAGGGLTPHTVTAQESKDWGIQEGSRVTIDQSKTLNDQFVGRTNAEHQVNQARDTKMSDELSAQLRPILQKTSVQAALSMDPAHGAIGGLVTAQKNAQDHDKALNAQIQQAQAKGDQAGAQKLQQQLDQVKQDEKDIQTVYNNGFSEKDKMDYAKDVAKERHDQAEEALQNRRADIQAAKEVKDKNVGASYGVENKELDTVRKPLSTSLDAFSTLRNSLDQGTAAGDSVVAPALLKALVAGGGVRITQAEINNFTHGRSSVEDLKGVLQKMTSGKSITPEQRQQVYSLLGAVESKVRMKNDLLNDAQEELDGASDVPSQRAAVSKLRRKLDQIDAGQSITTPNQQTPAAHQVPQGASNPVYAADGKTLIGHVVNGKYVGLGGQ